MSPADETLSRLLSNFCSICGRKESGCSRKARNQHKRRSNGFPLSEMGMDILICKCFLRSVCPELVCLSIHLLYAEWGKDAA